MLEQKSDATQRQPAATALVEPPSVPIVDLEVAQKVGLDRVTMLAQETQQARYSPASPKPAASAKMPNSSLICRPDHESILSRDHLPAPTSKRTPSTA